MSPPWFLVELSVLSRARWVATMWKVLWFLIPVGLTCIGMATEDDTPTVPNDTLPETISYDEAELGFTKLPRSPMENPTTDAKVQLGRKLFFDPILSVDGTVACASCHRPEAAFANNDKLAVGIGGKVGTRNVPSILNRGYGTVFTWDGGASSLEEQVATPLTNENELGNPDVESVVVRLKKDPALCKAV